MQLFLPRGIGTRNLRVNWNLNLIGVYNVNPEKSELLSKNKLPSHDRDLRDLANRNLLKCWSKRASLWPDLNPGGKDTGRKEKARVLPTTLKVPHRTKTNVQYHIFYSVQVTLQFENNSRNGILVDNREGQT